MRSRAPLVGVVAFMTLISGCGVVRNLYASVPIAPSVAFRVLSPSQEQKEKFNNAPAQTAVLRTQAEVDSFLAKLTTSRNPVPETLPALDFSKEQGVLVLFGPQPHSGYGGKIAAVEEQANRFLVHPVRLVPNNLLGGYAQMVVFPYQYIAIPRSEKPVEFAPTVDRPNLSPWWLIF